MFCVAAALNVLDVIFIMFISLLYVANGRWFMSEGLCRLNAWAQQVILKILIVKLKFNTF